MSSQRWIALGALWMGLAVVLGAFGAHALNDRLVETGHLEDWHTAVRYQAWHALALVLVGAIYRDRPFPASIGWLFLIGSLVFSGSIYGLCLDGPPPVLGPMTPLGGAMLIAGWAIFAWKAWRR
jgi:uncharacterized membrane protein YgdD (TMEM256/DUF423 family)